MDARYLIKDLMDVNRGSSPRPILDYLDNSGYRWLKISDFRLYDRYVYETKEFIKASGLKYTRFVPAGTLILTNSASLGIPIFLGRDMCVHDGFLFFTNIRTEIINVNYLYYWFLYNRQLIINQANGSVFKNLKKEIVENFEIKIPEINIQLKIIQILDCINSKIELNNKINKNLEAMASNVINSYFDECYDREKYNGIIKFIKGKKPNDVIDYYEVGYEKYLTIACLNGEENKYANIDNMLMTDHDILMVMDGASSGDTYFSTYGIVGSTLSKIEIINNNYIPEYLFFTLRKYKNDIQRQTTGTAIPHTNKNIVLNLEIPKINMNDQLWFKSILDKILQNNEENRNLSQLRDTLLPRLMNGEIDLSNVEV